jgi:hypothetical protein
MVRNLTTLYQTKQLFRLRMVKFVRLEEMVEAYFMVLPSIRLVGMKNSIHIIGVLAKIRTKYLTNTSQKC